MPADSQDPAAQPPASPAPAVRPPLSRWAVATLVVGVLSACPFFTIVPFLLGFVALTQCAKHGYRGQKLAILGMSIAFALTVGWVVVAMWWHKEVRVRVIEGPVLALVAGEAGDLIGFREEFVGRGGSATDAEAQAFLTEAQARWGRFISSTPMESEAVGGLESETESETESGSESESESGSGSGSESGSNPDAEADSSTDPTAGRLSLARRQRVGPPSDTTLQYLYTFEGGTVPVTAVFVFWTEEEILINRWSSFVLHDEIQGDLSFPPPVTDNGGG